ncbi:MAG TPA: heme-binding domain-containing protein [Chitinophagaceae bacterium]|nr:heme-binding domain-containing protein [Chitinophagaceae bacterium]
MIKKIFLVGLTIFVTIQFIRPAKNIKVDKNDNLNNDISSVYPVPENVKNILKASCYDCHSNNTYYPWYSNIQPVGWWMQFHVNEGKLELNFDEFASYDRKKQIKKLEEIIEEIKIDKMPLASYIKMHKEAKLTSQEKNIVTEWVSSVQNLIGKSETTNKHTVNE